VSLDRLDRPTRALVALAAAVARGDELLVEARIRECVANEVSAAWVDELLLQSLLMCGWPRTLNAAMAWRRTGGAAPSPGEDGTDYTRVAEWTARARRCAGRCTAPITSGSAPTCARSIPRSTRG